MRIGGVDIMPRIACLPLAALAAILALSQFGIARAETDSLDREIQSRVEQMAEPGALTIGERSIAAEPLVSKIYAQREFRPAWSSEGNVAALLDEIERSEDHGFEPDEFHRAQLIALKDQISQSGAAEATRAEYDILLTDALARLAYHRYFGKVDPVDLDDKWNFERPLIEGDPAKELNEVLDGEQVAAFFDEMEISDSWYDGVLEALARYRAIADKGGWPVVPDGPALKPGMSDPRVPVLRRRLAVTGDWQGVDSEADLYDADLEQAVRRFQARHGLEDDGVVGKGSLEVLNVPVEARIDQIRVNLERGRWVLRGLGENFVIVNIAGFETYMNRDGKEIWATKSIVGKNYRKTPVFRDEIRFIEFNPTWTVPPGILGKDILPKARENPSYISEKGFTVVDGKGKQIDPKSIDWSKAKPGNFPYSLVQPPGPENALGLVKFMFPNPYLVYLHDTPSRGLFAKSERAQSSGCVRLENPFDFAELLLSDQPEWTRKKIDEIVASGETTRVNLNTPLPVLLLYWTVWVDPDGQVSFRRDIYERDSRVLAALNDKFKPKPIIKE